MDKKVMMNKLSNMALWAFLFISLTGFCDDCDSEIHRLESENHYLSTELEDTQSKLRDAQDEIDQLKRR
jgi:hypothetical protein